MREVIDSAASEAAFNVTSAILHGLRPKLRGVVTEEFIRHPAYTEGNFPIWWQHQNNDQFIKQAKPPFFVRFSHHPLNTYNGVFKGHAHIQCYALTEPWVEALSDIVIDAYPAGEMVHQGDFAVTFREADPRDAWPVKGWDRTRPWPERAEFMIPVSVWWTIPMS